LVTDNKAVIKVDNAVIPRLIGKDGSMISLIEDKLGIHIDIEPRVAATGKEVRFDVAESGNSFDFRFDRKLVEKVANFYVDDKFLFSATVGKKYNIKVGKSSDIGRELMRAVVGKKKIKVLI